MTLLFYKNHMKTIISIGELLIDFIPTIKGKGIQGTPAFEKVAGGAPANVCVAASKLGAKTYFLGQVGSDGFGQFLEQELIKYGVDSTYLEKTPHYRTALAFVTLTEQGERDFIFYRDPSADQYYEAKSLDFNLLNNSILHFCSVSLMGYPILETHKRILEAAKNRNAWISFDPNVRLALSSDHQTYQKTIQSFLPYADVLKVSEDELGFISGLTDEDDQVAFFLALDVKMLIITRGKKGVSIYYKKERLDVPGYQATVVDTTGAGDAWIGSFLAQIGQHDDLDRLDISTLKRYASISNAFAAITTESKGAMAAMPSIDALKLWLEKHKQL